MEKGKNVGTPTVAGRQMSSSLKERLKKCGRYHNSPRSGTPVAKQQDSKLPLTPSEGQMSRVNSACSKNKTVLTPVTKRCATSPLCDKSREKRRIMGQTELIVPRKLDVLLSEGVRDEEEEKVEDLAVSKEPEKRTSETFQKSTKMTESKRCSENIESVSKLTKTSGYALKMGSPVSETDSETCVKDKFNRNSECNLVDEKTTDQSKNGEKGQGSSPEFVNQAVSEKKMQLIRELEEKEEQLRKLKMVKMYREKNNLEELGRLISKWRGVSQQALQDLHELMSEPKPTMTQLVDHLGIPHDLVNFDPDDESFY